MKVRVGVLALITLFVLGVGPVAGLGQVREYVPLTLTVSPAKSTYSNDEPIPLQIVFENTSGKKLKFPFQEKDVYGKPLPYPYGLAVRMVDEQGTVITQNDESRDEWWSWYLTWPPVTLVRRASKDRITLKQGERIERVVDLAEVLNGLEAVASELRPGTYTVQLSLKGVSSNEFQIEVRKGSGRARRVTRMPY